MINKLKNEFRELNEKEQLNLYVLLFEYLFGRQEKELPVIKYDN